MKFPYFACVFVVIDLGSNIGDSKIAPTIILALKVWNNNTQKIRGVVQIVTGTQNNMKKSKLERNK